MHPLRSCLPAADITCRLAGEQAEENENCNGVFRTGKKTVFFIAKSYLIPNQVSNFDPPNAVRLQRRAENTGSGSVWSSQHEM